jgi:ketosteroid isomerase-like protein
MKFPHLILLLTLILGSCNSGDRRQKAIREIRQAEEEFASMSKRFGADSAFHYFSDENVVLYGSDQIVTGRDSVLEYFKSRNLDDIRLDWTPEFIDAARSGDMGYTYGPLTFIAKDSSGNDFTHQTYYHSIWKKNRNGDWKVVFE